MTLPASEEEVYKLLVDADSICSLVAYREPSGLSEESVAELKSVSARARKIYQAMTP